MSLYTLRSGTAAQAAKFLREYLSDEFSEDRIAPLGGRGRRTARHCRERTMRSGPATRASSSPAVSEGQEFRFDLPQREDRSAPATRDLPDRPLTHHPIGKLSPWPGYRELISVSNRIFAGITALMRLRVYGVEGFIYLQKRRFDVSHS